jgi:hypothetical protein
MAEELPGIYVRTDTEELFVFDSVEAKVLFSGPSGVKVEIKNPTPFDAKVSVFAENGPRASQPLGCSGFLKWPKFGVKAGATVQIALSAGK